MMSIGVVIKRTIVTISMSCITVCMICLSEMTIKADESNNGLSLAYETCKESIITTGQKKIDDYFEGYLYEVEYPEEYTAEGVSEFEYYLGATEESSDLWLITEYSGTDPLMKDMRWDVILDGSVGKYTITIPISFESVPSLYQIIGSFDIKSYSMDVALTADDVVSVNENEGLPSVLKTQLLPYPTNMIPTSISILNWWIMENELDLTLKDFGFEAFSFETNISEDSLGTNTSRENASTSKTDSDKQNDNNISSQPAKSFTNKYGSSTTRCAHPGCNNYIASSGDTNCCPTHSNKCLDCGKYIDEDAMYCMDCLNKAFEQTDNYSYESSGNSSYSDNSSNIGAGGYEMPNENDESFSDYVQRVDPELYDELFN